MNDLELLNNALKALTNVGLQDAHIDYIEVDKVRVDLQWRITELEEELPVAQQYGVGNDEYENDW